jgi:hypothetical protein
MAFVQSTASVPHELVPSAHSWPSPHRWQIQGVPSGVKGGRKHRGSDAKRSNGVAV